MTASERVKRSATIEGQRKLLKKCRKQIKKLKEKIEYQKYLILLAREESACAAYEKNSTKRLLAKSSRAHGRMVRQRQRLGLPGPYDHYYETHPLPGVS